MLTAFGVLAVASGLLPIQYADAAPFAHGKSLDREGEDTHDVRVKNV